jgi:tetratricopeptide (TPR) repeat protein
LYILNGCLFSGMRRHISILICFFSLNGIFAQNSTIDSLKNLLPAATNEEKIDLYNELALSYRGVSYSQVKSYSIKSYLLANSLNRPQKMISALSNVAIACVFTGDMDSAGILFNTIFHLADSIGDAQLRNKALLNLGNFYLNTNKYDLALENYQLVYPEYLKINDTLNIAGIDQNIGNIYYHQVNYRKALDAFFLASAMYEKGGYGDEAKTLLNSIGLTYLKLNIHDSALLFLERGLKYSREKNDRELDMRVQNNLGLLYLENGQYSRSIIYFRNSMRLSKEIVNPFQEANALLNIAQVYIKKHQFDSAGRYLQEAGPIIKSHGNNQLLKDLNEYFYELYSGKKDFEKALSYFKKYKDVQDSIFSQETGNRIASWNIRFETAKKEAENNRLRSELAIKQITQNRLTIIIIIISLLFVTIIAAFFYIWKYLKQKNTISEQESQILSERLEFSTRELASKALHLASQSEFRVKLLETTNEVYDHLDETGKEGIQSLFKSLESNMDQSAWREFETRFEQVHETFFNKLNGLFPELTPNDRRICAFLKLDLSTKDIALLTHRSPRSIESARYRLKKKFGLGPEEDILGFLRSI